MTEGAEAIYTDRKTLAITQAGPGRAVITRVQINRKPDSFATQIAGFQAILTGAQNNTSQQLAAAKVTAVRADMLG